MYVKQVPLDVFGANCYVIAAAETGPCVVVDPGVGALAKLTPLLQEHRFEVAAVLLTHGHPDHVWECASVAGSAPVYLPAPDSYRMTDPLSLLGPMAQIAASEFPGTWTQPQNLQLLHDAGDGSMIELIPGVSVKMIPAPGHTEGSSLFFFAGPAGEISAAPIAALTGDVIFREAVGRTDLPGGDEEQMLHTLRTLCNSVDPQTCLLPGHGPVTTMAAELENNLYLRQARYRG